jgi:hypothetical protein
MTTDQYLKLFAARDVIMYIIEDSGVDIATAMEQFYATTVFEKLQDTLTGLYQESAGYIYDLYRIERTYGRLIQTEV